MSADAAEPPEPSEPVTLSIRTDRDGSFAVTYEGLDLPVQRIEIDPLSLKRLAEQQHLIARSGV